MRAVGDPAVVFAPGYLAGISLKVLSANAMVDTEFATAQEVRGRAARLPRRPKVFFEEWDDPLISGIGRVSELLEIVGGIDIFADRTAQRRTAWVTVEEVVARESNLIIGSWCGKRFRPERVVARAGFDRVLAIQHQDLYEIRSYLILRPGPAGLTDGLAERVKIVQRIGFI